MNTEKIIVIILIIFFGIVLLAVGYTLGKGLSFANQKIVLNTGGQQQIVKTIGVVSSKIVKTIIASGKVSSILGKTITITSEEESMNIDIKEETKISSISLVPAVKGGVSTTKQTPAKFSDIKTGDQLSVVIKVLPQGKIEAVSITIFPTINKP